MRATARTLARPAPEFPAARPATLPSSGGDVVGDMVALLASHGHGSTAEALALLRERYPSYPLTLRLAALVAHTRRPQPA